MGKHPSTPLPLSWTPLKVATALLDTAKAQQLSYLEPAHAEVITRLSRMHEGHPDVDGAPPMSAIDTVLARLPRDPAP